MKTMVLELRQYKLHPGQRDVLIALFEREFIESQEALGMRLVGQFPPDADERNEQSRTRVGQAEQRTPRQLNEMQGPERNPPRLKICA